MTKPRKPIPKVSPRQRARNLEYAAVKLQWWADLERVFGVVRCCWPGCRNLAEREPHHVYGRVGSLQCDARTFRPMCAVCHSLIHTNAEHQAAAVLIGLYAPFGWWNRNPFEVTR